MQPTTIYIYIYIYEDEGMVEIGGAAQFRQRSTRVENATNENQRVCSEIPLEHRKSHSAPFLGGEG